MTYKLNFDGFWNIDKINFIPSCKGIFVVFAACFKSKNQDIIQSLQPIFIGASENIKASINHTHSILKWQTYLKPNEQLYFNATCMEEEDLLLKKLSAKLIVMNQPMINSNLEDETVHLLHSFKIKCTGMCFGLKDSLVH